MSVLARELTAVVSVVFSPDYSVDFGSCRLIATAADRGRDAQQPYRPEPRQCAILVGPGQLAISDHIRRQDRREFPSLDHDFPPQSVARR